MRVLSVKMYGAKKVIKCYLYLPCLPKHTTSENNVITLNEFIPSFLLYRGKTNTSRQLLKSHYDETVKPLVVFADNIQRAFQCRKLLFSERMIHLKRDCVERETVMLNGPGMRYLARSLRFADAKFTAKTLLCTSHATIQTDIPVSSFTT